jgi:hypothetical protein
MFGTCSTHVGEMRNSYNILIEKLKGDELLGDVDIEK